MQRVISSHCLKVSIIILSIFSTAVVAVAADLQCTFHELANNFHMLDQVSGGIPQFFHIPAYKEVLKGILKECKNSELLKSYKELRVKYQQVPAVFSEHVGASANLFAPNAAEYQDPIADAFYTSVGLEEALDKLSVLLTDAERDCIRTVFTACQEACGQALRAQQDGLIYNLEMLNTHIDQQIVREHVANIRDFYQSSQETLPSVHLVWCPEEAGFSGACIGDRILIRISGKKIPHVTTAQLLVSVIVHEITHHISAKADTQQKKALSELFLSRCDVSALPHILFALEEPLVMATQMVFVEKACRHSFKKDDSLFNHPLAAQLFPLVKKYLHQGKAIDASFIRACARAYNGLCSSFWFRSALFIKRTLPTWIAVRLLPVWMID